MILSQILSKSSINSYLFVNYFVLFCKSFSLFTTVRDIDLNTCHCLQVFYLNYFSRLLIYIFISNNIKVYFSILSFYAIFIGKRYTGLTYLTTVSDPFEQSIKYVQNKMPSLNCAFTVVFTYVTGRESIILDWVISFFIEKGDHLPLHIFVIQECCHTHPHPPSTLPTHTQKQSRCINQ